MITKNDLYLLLSDLQDNGINTKEAIKNLMASRDDIPIDVLEFINSHRQLDLTKFYDKLRKSYNHKKSKLYISIVKENNNPETILTTLSSLLLQISLFAKQSDNKEMFLKHSRAKEISLVLYKYYIDYDLTNCMKLLRLIKSDLIASEIIEGRRKNI